ncbi:MAG: leucyl/phenylalanyl-tRNA--protein transferase [Burkholderiales bacterium]|nr:leucyl/phenylalanyl-tRNA--protein transferase [Burkholderiales bacterium]
MSATPALPVLRPGAPFPPASQAWSEHSPAPGLVAAGGALDVPSLLAAYGSGLFPWFSAGEPILWWSPDPRMVLAPARFRLHRSLRRTLQRFVRDGRCEIRMDSAFDRVITACAQAPRPGQSGTWIGPAMRHAYQALHAAGHAHSVETWVDGRLVAGLYGVGIGRMVFGESMFTTVTDGSKLALAALVAWARHHRLPLIDCQQQTGHLASLGAAPMPRGAFVEQVRALATEPAPAWQFKPVYWTELTLGPP